MGDRNKWVVFLTSRTVWVSVATIIAAGLKEFYKVELSTETFTGILVGVGGVLAYLLNKDRVEAKVETAKANSPDTVVNEAINDPEKMQALLNSLTKLVK